MGDEVVRDEKALEGVSPYSIPAEEAQRMARIMEQELPWLGDDFAHNPYATIGTMMQDVRKLWRTLVTRE